MYNWSRYPVDIVEKREEKEEKIGGDGVFGLTRLTHEERGKVRVKSSYIRGVGWQQRSSCFCILAVTCSL